MDASDMDLLDRWRRSRDREAMDQLIRRHIHFVYGAARRILGDSSFAEDVTQAVFMLLIQKSPRLPSAAALAVWLHRTTRYACANARKMQVRRERRDRRSAKLEQTEMGHDIDNSDERERLLPLLDEAITQLGEHDRSGLILCYFQRRTFREIGAMLGTSEEAARKRVMRSVDRIREYFAARGVVMAGSAAIVACLAHESAVAAPAQLASATAKLAGLSQIAGTIIASTASASAVGQITKGVLHTMLVSKLKLAAAACAALALGGVITTTAIQMVRAQERTIAGTVVASGAVMLTADPAEPDAHAITLDGGTEIDFLGVANLPAAETGWFSLNGEKIQPPQNPFTRNNLPAPSTKSTKQVMLHVNGPQRVSIHGEIAQAAEPVQDYVLDGAGNEQFWLFAFRPKDGQNTVDVEVHVAEGEWKRLCEAKHKQGEPLGMFETPLGGIAMTPVMESPRGSIVYITHEPWKDSERFSAVDQQGNLHECSNIYVDSAGKIVAVMAEFEIPPSEVAMIVVDTRPFSKKVVVKNVTLDPSKPTKPQIEVKEIADGK